MALPRVFISTDLRLSSEEKDDAQSLIHSLLYQDKMNIVGIAGTASKWNHQDGLVGDIDKIIDVYAKDYAKLDAWNSAFKSPAELKAVSWQGATDTAPMAGWSKPTASSQAIIAEAKKAAAAGEKLNVLTWGGGTDLAQALHDDPSIAPTIRYFNINNQDASAHRYIGTFKGKMDMWVDDMSTFRGIYATPESAGIIKGWHEVNAKGHGALGDYFSQLSGDIFNASGVKMGDSPTILRFLSGDQNDPSKESWGGEFIKAGTNYWTDNPGPSLALRGYKGAMTIYEDRAEWLNSFAQRFDILKGSAPAPTPEPAPTPTPTPAADLNLVIAGDSNGTADYSGKNPWLGMKLGKAYEVDNHSVSGITLDTQANAKLNAILADYKVRADNVLVVQAGGNDLRADYTTQAMYADTTKLVQAAEAKGFDVVVATVLPKAATSSRWDASDEAERIAYNNLVRENKAGAGAIADVAAHPTMGTAAATANKALYSDGVHVTASAMTQYLQSVYASAILKAVDGTPAPTPSDPTTPSEPTGPGADTITVKIAGTAYKGDPKFAIYVDGKVVDLDTVVAADFGKQWDTFTFKGDFDGTGTQKHKIEIDLINNFARKGVGDRNLYVDAVTFNGVTQTQDVAITSHIDKDWFFTI